MTDYRVVVRHVRYWRGAVHRWSTVYPYTGTLSSTNYANAIAIHLTTENAVNYNKTGEKGGGVFEIALYNSASGGVPVAISTYFDWTSPAAWTAYNAIDWSARSFALNTDAEAALQVEWAAGLSRSGKPVHFRKWFHSIPVEANAPGTADFTSGELTTIIARFTTLNSTMSGYGVPLGRGSRLAALSPTIRQYAGNHQMPRGRRRKVAVGSFVSGNLKGVPVIGPLELA